MLMQHEVRSQLNEHVHADFLYHPALNKLGTYLVPESLWGALVLQFSESVAGGKSNLRRCPECDAWMGNRVDSEYCSVRCRARAYRKRQRDAKRLHAEGMTPAAIAKQLGSDTATVRGWLKATSTTRRGKK